MADSDTQDLNLNGQFVSSCPMCSDTSFDTQKQLDDHIASYHASQYDPGENSNLTQTTSLYPDESTGKITITYTSYTAFVLIDLKHYSIHTNVKVFSCSC